MGEVVLDFEGGCLPFWVRSSSIWGLGPPFDPPLIFFEDRSTVSWVRLSYFYGLVHPHFWTARMKYGDVPLSCVDV